MAPKKKKGGEGDADTEEIIGKQFSLFKNEYRKKCEELKCPEMEPKEWNRVNEMFSAEGDGKNNVRRVHIMGKPLGPAGCKAIAASVKALQTVVPQPDRKVPLLPPYKYVKVDWLSIHKCDAVDEGAHVLSELLRNEHGIERFDLIENDIGWAGANEIGIHLKANMCLTALNLDMNPMGDEGIAALADGLRWNYSLKELSLGDCGIGCYGAGALAQDVIANDYCQITNLNLHGNELEPEGVASIADSLKNNITLTSIDLSDTGMGNSEISRDAVREALVRHPTLTALNLNLNAIGPEGGQMLLEVLSLNTNIVRCDVFERLVMFRDIQDKVAENGSKKKKGKKKKKKK